MVTSFQITAALFLVLNFTVSAEAYLDGGTGSMFLQMVLGGFAGILLVIKLFWHEMRSFLGLRDPKHEDPTGDEPKSTAM